MFACIGGGRLEDQAGVYNPGPISLQTIRSPIVPEDTEPDVTSNLDFSASSSRLLKQNQEQVFIT